jgi:uncharacterized protein YbjT (DUF2867 family)
MVSKTAVVFGSTGLVGNLLLEELLASGKYDSIKIFVRKPAEITHPKITEYIVNIQDVASFEDMIKGDDLFICLGTTIKKAGSIKIMEAVDCDLPVSITSAAFKNGVKRLAVVSSIGANPSSSNYYLKIKGKMEEGIMKYYFENVAIVRPSMLLGERKEKRSGEIAGKIFMKLFNPILNGKMKKYRSIHARDVARAMISILSRDQVKVIYESDELQFIASLYQPENPAV